MYLTQMKIAIAASFEADSQLELNLQLAEAQVIHL
jgi:hypothetical protein